MDTPKAEQSWRTLSEDIISGMLEWRQQHPKATLQEIEAALDERLARMRARMVQDLALGSGARDWSAAEGERPKCPHCGAALQARGPRTRRLQTHGGQTLELARTYGVCPACGAGLFPPR